MQVKTASSVGRFSQSIAFLPRTIVKHPNAFVVLCFKAFLSMITPLSGDFLGITLWAVGGQNYYNGSYIAWVAMSRLIYVFWLALPIAHPSVTAFLGIWFYNPVPSMVLLLFLLKLPMLIADAVIGVLIYKIILSRRNSHEEAYRGFKAWFYNPLVVLLGVMFGSIDIVASMLVLASVYCFARNRILPSFLLLFVSIVLRTYPILLTPILLILLWQREGTRRKLMIGLIAVTGFAVILIMFWLNMVTNGLFFLTITILQHDYLFFLSSLIYPASGTGGEPIALTVVLLVLTMFLIYDRGAGKEARSGTFDNRFQVLDYVSLFLLVLLGFSYWNPQFLLWILPFAAIDLGLRKSSKWLFSFFILTAALVIIISFGFYLTSLGNSFFFIQNSNPLMAQLSQWINTLSNDVNQTLISVVLRFPFIAVCTVYLLKGSKRLIFAEKDAISDPVRIRGGKHVERRPALQKSVKGSVPRKVNH
ncbi:MAG: hypothetical protein WED05_12250 [Candidatus Atabeyarchaeum deiterrae]